MIGEHHGGAAPLERRLGDGAAGELGAHRRAAGADGHALPGPAGVDALLHDHRGGRARDRRRQLGQRAHRPVRETHGQHGPRRRHDHGVGRRARLLQHGARRVRQRDPAGRQPQGAVAAVQQHRCRPDRGDLQRAAGVESAERERAARNRRGERLGPGAHGEHGVAAGRGGDGRAVEGDRDHHLPVGRRGLGNRYRVHGFDRVGGAHPEPAVGWVGHGEGAAAEPDRRVVRDRHPGPECDRPGVQQLELVLGLVDDHDRPGAGSDRVLQHLGDAAGEGCGIQLTDQGVDPPDEQPRIVDHPDGAVVPQRRHLREPRLAPGHDDGSDQRRREGDDGEGTGSRHEPAQPHPIPPRRVPR